MEVNGMARPLIADLRSIEDDGRRWWAITGNTYGAPWFYAAPSGRQAVTEHRRDSIAADVSQGYSRREATGFIQAQNLRYAGPYTTRQAFVLDAGWTLAWAVCDTYRGLTLVPRGPIDDLDDCVPMVDDAKVDAILNSAAKLYTNSTT